jgi:hypothetical protein
MLEWLYQTHADTAKRLKAVEVERARLQGGLAALEAAITQARNEAGGGNGTAPGATEYPYQKPETNQSPGPMSMVKMLEVQGVQQAVKVPNGPIQADQELRE